MKSLILCFSLLFAIPAWADLTPTQRTTLRTDILADPVLSVLQPSSNAIYQIIDVYKAAPTVACTVWRSSVPADEYREAITWTAVDGLTTGKARIWDWVTASMTLPINASKTSIRQGIADAWGATSATGVALASLSKRSANRLEKLFATGACTTASPSIMAIEGELSYSDVLQVMGW